jgi:hypothetical protein
MGPSADTPAWKPLGELLVEQCWLTPADLEQALELQAQSGQKLGQIVVARGFITVEELTTVLLEQCGIDMSTQDGFGSGLRDELAKRGGRRGREPVRFEFSVEPEPEKKRKKQQKQEQPVLVQDEPPPAPEPPKLEAARRSRRVRLGRNPYRKPLKRLEKLVADFERQERELVETITSLRQMLRPVGD